MSVWSRVSVLRRSYRHPSWKLEWERTPLGLESLILFLPLDSAILRIVTQEIVYTESVCVCAVGSEAEGCVMERIILICLSAHHSRWQEDGPGRLSLDQSHWNLLCYYYYAAGNTASKSGQQRGGIVGKEFIVIGWKRRRAEWLSWNEISSENSFVTLKRGGGDALQSREKRRRRRRTPITNKISQWGPRYKFVTRQCQSHFEIKFKNDIQYLIMSLNH